ncbi:ribose-phosphate pyrophosphokinase [Aurantiacibacter sp. D1-12]|uniref:ribose-phosphate pyrophosphokinase n=1 Tax=Aurantiacibacter sp. D1-12 TaxID=2993658 RepID=UPI00237C6BB1|nr:ribose-phosphate pyrophosphokinase [Aurantiacibacter sp. D1-12]MDE1467401.1 ribose-phosphate pyrophosphokinase [Aurantiacibacter sp. D1-12]
MDRSLAEFLDESGLSEPTDTSALYDVERIRGILVDAAKAGEAVSYSEMLGKLGFRFTRPKMRTLCRTLDAIDSEGRAKGEPELAVLVVRESDRLPGQGWWTGRTEYKGEWTGAEALRFVEELQAKVFDFWSESANGNAASSM